MLKKILKKTHLKKMPSINVCILGGGGGTSNLMHILNPLLNKSISKLVGIISISDDGGSTGVLKMHTRQHRLATWESF